MDLDGDLAERIRAVLAGTGIVRKVRMVGGLCFMVNGNMVAGTSKHGLLVRVGKDQHSRALARPDAKPMELSGRPMEGYVFIDPPPRDERTLRDWLERCCFREHLAAKASAVDAPADQDRHADQRAAVSVRGARPVYRFGFSAELSTRFTKD